MRSVGDKSLAAVDDVVIPVALGGGADSLQIRSCARFRHCYGTYKFTGGEFGEPFFFLLLRSVFVDVGRNDCGVNDIPETVIGAHALFPNNSCLLGEVTATATELFRDRDAQQPSITGFVPHFAVNLMVFTKSLKVRHNFIGKKDSRKVGNRFYVLGHPRGFIGLRCQHCFLLFAGLSLRNRYEWDVFFLGPVFPLGCSFG